MSIFRGLFNTGAEENGQYINVYGLNGRDLGKFISGYWKTSVLEKHMFTKIVGGRFGRVEFYKFFAVDVVYMMSQLVKAKRTLLPIRTLNQIKEAIERDTWYKDTLNDDVPGRLDFSKLSLFNFNPKVFQRGFLEYYDKKPNQYHLKGALLDGKPGTGKTFTSICTMELAGVDKIIVVCPKKALDQVWIRDPYDFYKKVPTIWNSNMMNEPGPDTKIYIYHYEALEKAFIHHRNLFGQYNYGMILDESHNLNDVKAQRTQRWLELVKQSGSNNIIHASGTPWKALGSESIPLLRAIDPMFTPKVEEAFRKIYGNSAQKGLDILRNRLGLVSFTILKDELGLDKPEITQVPVKIPDGKPYTLTTVKEEMQKFIIERVKYYKEREEEDLKFYQQCLDIHYNTIYKSNSLLKEFEVYKNYIKRIQKTSELSAVKEEISFCKKYEFNNISSSLPREWVKDFRSVCSIIKYLALKIQGECLGQVVGRIRIKANEELARYIPYRDICQSTLKKTVIFTSFVEALESCKQTCIEQELNPIVVYAKTNKNLNSMINEFRDDEKINPLIATYHSLSDAVPLVMADTMIMINAPFRAYIQEQAISRIHRLGQNNTVRIFQCVLDTGNEPNISSRSLDIMKWSQEQVEALTGVKSPYTIDNIDEGGFEIAAESMKDYPELIDELYGEELCHF